MALAALCLACSPAVKTSCEPPSSPILVLASAHWKPVIEGGVAHGVEVRDVVAGSFLACLGVRDGDRLVALDGERIPDPSALAKLGKRRALRLQVEDASGRAREIVNQ
ncbi:MAG TPA: PDZ domain-containing protein [Myxococcota bacterium]|nr:PDZ domain-containing protein [Myxococcota bacterium]